jgi:hypothetical protein
MNLPGLRFGRLRYDAQVAALKQWRSPICRFAAARDARELRMLRIRIEHKSPITAFRRRGAPGEDAAPTRLQAVEAEEVPGVKRRRKLLEVQRPGFLAGGVEGFARVLDGLPRAAR